MESWLRADITLRASVICERLTASYGFTGSYQRVKMHVAEVRPKIAAELAASDENPLAGLHRRFEVVARAQAQVDWGEESGVLIGTPKVYSFHMTLFVFAGPVLLLYRPDRPGDVLRLPHPGVRLLRAGCPARWSMTGPRPW